MGHAPAMELYDALIGAIGAAFGSEAQSEAEDGDSDVLEFGPEEEV